MPLNRIVKRLQRRKTGWLRGNLNRRRQPLRLGSRLRIEQRRKRRRQLASLSVKIGQHSNQYRRPGSLCLRIGQPRKLLLL